MIGDDFIEYTKGNEWKRKVISQQEKFQRKSAAWAGREDRKIKQSFV